MILSYKGLRNNLSILNEKGLRNILSILNEKGLRNILSILNEKGLRNILSILNEKGLRNILSILKGFLSSLIHFIYCRDMHKASPYRRNRPFGVCENVVGGHA